MKKVLIAVIITISCGYISAQKNYEKSQLFDEIDGWNKLILLRNGNTGLLDITNKDGANFTLYDGSRKKIMSSKIKLTKVQDKLKGCQIQGVYDISGDFVFFLSVVSDDGDKKRPTLYRIILNGSNGQLKSEDILGQLDELNMGVGYAIAFGDLDVPDFFVEKDPNSDYYAVIRYNTIAAESNERIEVSHYGPDHKLISKTKYNTPTDKYKFIKYLGAYVHKDDYVFIGTHGFNTKKSGGEESRFYVAQISKGKTNFVQKELVYTEYTKFAKSYFTYNKVKDIVSMHIVVNNKSIDQNVNPTTLQLEKPYNIDFTKANEYFKTQMGRKNDFSGILEGSFTDKNGNITYLYQEVSKKVQSSGMGMPAQVVGTILGDVVLVTMSPDGKEVYSGAFAWNVYRKGDHDPFCYNTALKGRRSWASSGGTVFDNDWYYGISLVSTENASYLFFNNTIDNMEKPVTEEAGRVTGISGTAGVKYTYKNGVITSEFLFEKPENKKEAKFINPGASDYNVTNKTYATVLTDPREKKSCVVWMKLD